METKLQRLAKNFLDTADKFEKKVTNYLCGSNKKSDVDAYNKVKASEVLFLYEYNRVFGENIKAALNYDLAESVLEDKNEDVLEPFDPAYLSDKGYEIPQISAKEKKFLHKLSILENKLKKAKVRYEWLERWRCFRVHRFFAGSEYPTYRYVRVNMEENDYSFGTEDEDLVFDGKSSVVVKAVSIWVNSKGIKK